MVQDRRTLRDAILALAKQPVGFESRKGAEIERVARRVLALAGIRNAKHCERLGQIMTPSWREAIREDFHNNSPEDIAARALDVLGRVRIAIDHGDADGAAEEAVTLGALAVQLGKKMDARLTGRKNIENVHGTDGDRDAERQEIIAAWNLEMDKAASNFEMDKGPRPRKGDADRAIAKRFHVGERTVFRARTGK